MHSSFSTASDCWAFKSPGVNVEWTENIEWVFWVPIERLFQNFSGLVWTGPRFPQDGDSKNLRSSDSCIRIITSLFSESLPSLEVALNDREIFRFFGAKPRYFWNQFTQDT